MSTAVFPALVGFMPPARTILWNDGVQIAKSGKEVRTGYWTAPRYQWDLGFDILNSAALSMDFQTFFGFFNRRLGRTDSFLYQDDTDNAVTGQSLGTGDGVATAFPLIRSFGGFIEPVLAPNVVSTVYINGSPISSSLYTISSWGATVPGVITFGTAPGLGLPVAADFSYYFPVRFLADSMLFTEFMTAMWEAKTVSIISIK
jgi:uncharacterized protein (TIGR02217 family)